MPTFRENAIVLKSRAMRDADRHYVLFTESRGKVTVLAKGSRKGKSKLAPHLAPFGIVDVMIAKGRITDRLAGAVIVKPHRNILGSLGRMSLAQAYLLAVDALVKRDLPDDRTFRLITEFLEAVEAAPDPDPDRRSPLFDAAIARLLDNLGFGLELRECVACRQALVPEGNALNILRGGMECADCRVPLSTPISADAIKALRFFRSEPVAAAGKLVLAPSAAREITFLTDLLLTNHLEGRFHALRYIRSVA